MKLITRAECRLRPPKHRILAKLNRASTGHWNGNKILVDGKKTWDHSKCASLVRGIQNFHMDGHGWDDIAYNFIECPHGYTFEGRGINVVNAANGTNVANLTSHAIMSLAGQENPFPDEEKVGFRSCVKYIADRTDAPNKAVGHRDHKATSCPGDERYNWIHKGLPTSFGDWPHRPKPELRQGSTGDAVRYLQNVIHKKIYENLSVNGNFGPATEGRVKDVQRSHNLTPDGIVGPKTWGIIDSIALS